MEHSNIRKVLVVGAGSMGHGIAQVFASGEYSVRLVDLNQAVLDKALHQINSNLQTLSEAGVQSASDTSVILKRIETGTNVEQAAEGVDLAIEAVSEDAELKHEIFDCLDQCCSPEAILLSNTSSLNIFEKVRVRQPERLCIAHWYAPPHIIPLVDVVKGPETSQKTVDTVVDVLRNLGKKPIVLDKFIPGYLINRIQVAIGREVNYLLDNGYATPQQLDESVKQALAPRMMVLGVVQRMDFTGLKVSLKIQQELADKLAPVPSFETIQNLIDSGHLGVSTSKGFFDYGKKSTEQILKERDSKLLNILRTQNEAGDVRQSTI